MSNSKGAAAVAAVAFVAASGSGAATIAFGLNWIVSVCCVTVGIAAILLPPALRSPTAPLMLTMIAVFGVGLMSRATGIVGYAPTVIAVLAVILIQRRISIQRTALGVAVLLLVAYGLLGTIYGRINLGTERGALPILLPLIVVGLAGAGSQRWEPSQVRPSLAAISVLGSGFMVAIGISYAFEGPGASVFNHEKAFLAIATIGFAVTLRRVSLILLALSATIFAIWSNPAATHVLVAAAALGTVGLARLRPQFGIRLAASAAVITGGLAATVAGPRFTDWLSVYFTAVGKVDNSATRLQLVTLGLDSNSNPIHGSMFARDLTVRIVLSGEIREVPVHNDFITLYIAGGIVAIVLFAAIVLFFNSLVLGRLSSVDSFERRALITLLATVNAAVASSLANPVLMNVTSTVLMTSAMAAAIMTCQASNATMNSKIRPGGSPKIDYGLGFHLPSSESP